MNDLLDWLIHIPEYLGAFGNWLTSPISDLLPFSPLAAIGTSAVAVVGIIVVAKVVHLIIG